MKSLAVAILFALTISGCEPSANVNHGSEPDKLTRDLVIVTLTFDDTHANQLLAVEKLNENSMHGTFYVNSPRIGTPTFLTKDNLDEMAAAGHEIGGHTLSHSKVLENETDIAKVREEICDDLDNLTSMGYQVSSFAYPYGKSGGLIKQVVESCYENAREIGGIGGNSSARSESIPPRDDFGIRCPSSVTHKHSVAALQQYITNAQENGGGWIPLVFHHITDDPEQDYAIAPEKFQELVEWLAEERENGRVEIKTISNVMSD